VRAQPGGLLAELTLDTDHHAEPGGGGQTDDDVDLVLREVHSASMARTSNMGTELAPSRSGAAQPRLGTRRTLDPRWGRRSNCPKVP